MGGACSGARDGHGRRRDRVVQDETFDAKNPERVAREFDCDSLYVFAFVRPVSDEVRSPVFADQDTRDHLRALLFFALRGAGPSASTDRLFERLVDRLSSKTRPLCSKRLAFSTSASRTREINAS